MWAMMPMLRVRSSERSRDIRNPALPAVVGERPVGVRHAVRLFALAHRFAALGGRVEQLGGELLAHRLARARAGVLDDPAHRQRAAPGRSHFDGHLIRGAADAAALHFHARADVVERAAEQANRLLLRALFDQLERAVGDRLGDALLAALHQHVDELRDLAIAELRIRGCVPPGHLASSRHLALLFPALGAVATAGLVAAVDTERIESSADDVVADAGKILDAAAADQHHRVFLQVVSLARDVRPDLAPVRQAHAGDFAQRRIRLLRRVSRDADAHTTALRTLHQVPRLDLLLLDRPPKADELLDGRHLGLPSLRYFAAQTHPCPAAGRRPGNLTPLQDSPVDTELCADPCTGTAPSGPITDRRPPLGRRRIIIGKRSLSNDVRTRQPRADAIRGSEAPAKPGSQVLSAPLESADPATRPACATSPLRAVAAGASSARSSSRSASAPSIRIPM